MFSPLFYDHLSPYRRGPCLITFILPHLATVSSHPMCVCVWAWHFDDGGQCKSRCGMLEAGWFHTLPCPTFALSTCCFFPADAVCAGFGVRGMAYEGKE